MNICGCLVHVAPEHTEYAARDIEGFEGVEIHATSGDGRLVVVVEDTADQLASEIIMALHQVPGVISLTLTYHHFEDVTKPHVTSQATSHPQVGGPVHDHL